jgi:CMP-N-acetylneuraminic acid synthetase
LSKKPIAIIPARLNSKRLSRKNIIKINNKPLIAWSIRKALRSKLFSKVIVSSESLNIKSIAIKEGSEFHHRKPNLSKDTSTVVEVCQNVLNNFDKSINEKMVFCCIYPTALLLTIEDLKKSYKNFSISKYDSLISASEYNLPPFQALLPKKGFWHLAMKKYEKIQSNKYPNILCDAGMFYWTTKKILKKNKSFYSKKLGIHKIPIDRVCDINTKNDFKLMVKNLKNLKNDKKIFI